MDLLKEGYKRFRDKYFSNYIELFENLSKGQQPRALLITCVDSRIDPSLIFNTKPGEILVLRNPGNVIPPYEEESDYSVSGTVEFAVNKLGIRRIYICGHSDCGAIKGLFEEEDFFYRYAQDKKLDFFKC